MNIKLHYGKGTIDLSIAAQNIAQIITPAHHIDTTSNDDTIACALKQNTLDEFANLIKDKQLCILIGDGTRDMPTNTILPHLAPTVKHASAVQIIISTGTHSPDTPENHELTRQIEAICNDNNIPHTQIAIHDCANSQLASAGATKHGTKVSYNTLIESADIFLVLSDVKCHYFAGYSNPIKNFVPGICDYETARSNHSLALDERSTFGIHPWHSDPTRRDNPLAIDQLNAMNMILRDRPLWAFVTVSTSGNIPWANFGPAPGVSSNAFDYADSTNAFKVQPAKYLIVSPGGLPNDIDLYISQRALELTANAVTPDGNVLFISACPNGIGEPHTMENFYNPLTKPLDQILNSPRGQYKLFSHKPVKFAQMIHRLRTLWVHSEIPADLITAAHMSPTDNPQQVVNDWIANDPDARINIVDGANKLAIYKA